MTVGLGTPVMEQTNLAVSPSLTCTSLGLVVNSGAFCDFNSKNIRSMLPYITIYVHQLATA